MCNKEKYVVLEDSVRHSYMGIVWSHKIQEKQADNLTRRYKFWEFLRIICTSMTSVGLISLIFADEFVVKIIVTIISVITTTISLSFKSFNMQGRIVDHKKCANELLIIRDKFRLLLVDIGLKEQNVAELMQKYNTLVEELWNVYKDAPSTTNRAVRLAAKALKISKDNEFLNEEIDANLPETLRWKKYGDEGN